MTNEPIFEIKEEEKKKDYSRFVIAPLERGYGSTLGNSLRRVLLTSLNGAAITGVRIASVKHQFTTLKGMREDVVDFLLNLKKVKLTSSSTGVEKAEISVSGPKEVKASDIKTSSAVKIVNPDLVIANLNKGSKLEAKLEIESGSGYSPAEERATGEIGYIPLDAAFSPVLRVNYRVEETRVGRLTNYDKLVMEIWSDGTFDPKEALIQSAKTLAMYLNQIVTPKKLVKKEEKSEEGLGNAGKLSVEEIGLPTRVANALARSGYETVEDLVGAKRDVLVKVRNLGEKSVEIIESALEEKGLSFTG